MIYLILFIYLFNPPILPFNMIHILSGISLVYIICYKRNEIIQLLKRSKFNIFILLMLVVICYIFIIIFVSNKSYEILLSYILILENIPVVFFIYYYCQKKKISIYELLKKIIIVGTIQGCIALITYINPTIHEYLVNILMKNGYGTVLEQLSSHRIYGFASNLTYSTPILQMFLAIIGIEMIIVREEKWAYLCIPILIVSSVINARTSIGVLLAGIICIMLFNLNKKNYKYVLIIVIVLICSMSYILSYDGDSSNIKWIKVGISEILDFSQGEKTGYFDTLFNKFIVFPEGLELIGGTGNTIFGNEEIGSDVGFINDIWLGGILLCLQLYTANIYIILKVKFKDKKIKNFYILFTLLTVIIMNIKGIYTQGNNVLNLIMLLFGISNIICTKKEEKIHEESTNNNNYRLQ